MHDRTHLAFGYPFALRVMITNAKQCATARGLTRKNVVHGMDEYRVPTDDEFEFLSVVRNETEREGHAEVEDPDQTLLSSSLTAENAIMCLVLLIYIIIS